MTMYTLLSPYRIHEPLCILQKTELAVHDHAFSYA